MRLRTAAFAIVAFSVSSSAAQAHDFIEGASFLNGFLHPLLVPAHALCVLAFGLMAGQQSSRIFLTALFPAALIAGILLIMYAVFPIEHVSTVLLASGACAGLLTALAQPLPRVIPAVILIAGGLSLIIDSVPAVVSKRDTILALSGTVLAAALVLALVAYLATILTRDWQRIGVRILGSWTAASTLLVLALQFAR
jgi:hydrogenase/urease accessory protein HupE